MNRFLRPIMLSLTLLCCLPLWTTAQDYDLRCYNYEDIPVNTVFGVSTGNEVGDLIFNEGGLTVALQEMDPLGGAPPLFGDVILLEASNNLPPSLITGKYLLFEDVGLLFEWNADHGYLEELCFNFWSDRDLINLEINGEGLYAGEDLNELHGQEVAPGVRLEIEPLPATTPNTFGGKVCLKGKIKSLRLGGNHLSVDDICYRTGTDEPICGLTRVRAHVQQCIPGIAPQLVVNVGFNQHLSSNSFDLYLNGEFWGYYKYRDLPLVLNRFPQTDYLKVEVCENDLPNCCVATEVEYLSCPDQFCLDFNELSDDTVWGRDAGHEPGQEVYRKEGVKVSVESFLYPDGTSDFWNAKVTQDIFGADFPFLNGQYFFISNINLKFDFTEVISTTPDVQTVEGVCFDFVDGGGEENISVNGEPIKVVQNLRELEGQEVAPGVFLYFEPYNTASLLAGKICLRGNIKSLTIGGQEFAFDNLCLLLGDGIPDCNIHDLVVRPLPCTPNGVFYAEMKFEVENPTSEGYIVYINGEPSRKYRYDEPFPKIGPFVGDHNDVVYLIEVRDIENPNCGDSFLLESIPCTPGCGIGALRTFIKSCNEDGSYNVWVNFDHDNSLTSGFDLYVEGAFYGYYQYEQLPLLIEGFVPTTDGLEFELKVCENDLPDCCLSATIDLRNACPVRECIDFEDYPANMYGMEAGNMPGDVIFSNDAYRVSLHTFQGIDWMDHFKKLSVTTAPSPFRWGGSGQHLYYEQISTVFNFTDFPGGVHELSFDFAHLGGMINFGINGGPILPIFRLESGTYPLGNGVIAKVEVSANGIGKVTLKGNILTLLIGGGNLRVDNMCINRTPECEIYDIVAEVVECDEREGLFAVELDFKYENVSDEFVLWLNNGNPRTYRYADLPLWLGGLSGYYDRELKVVIKDSRYAGCVAEAHLGPFDDCFGCGISDVEKEIICHPDEGTYDMWLKFEHQNTGSDGFNVTVDGQEFGPFSYADLPIKLESLPWTEPAYHELIICDLLDPDCCIIERYQIECQPGECEIGELRVAVGDCEDDGAFRVKLDFEYENTSEKFYVLTNYSNQVYGPFAYADLPVEVGPFWSPAGDEVVIGVVDAENRSCSRKKSLGVIDCRPNDCDLSHPVFGEVACNDDGTFSVKLDFEYENPVSDYFVVVSENGYEEKFAYADLPVVLENVPIPNNQDFVWFKVFDSDDHECRLEAKLEVSCPPLECKLYDLEFGEVACNDDGTISVKMDFEYENTSEYFVVWTETGYEKKFAYADLPVSAGKCSSG